ncbi:3-dehydroshikimate dehydratase [Alicyclobacillus sacchari]|uniref:3-dehydroshikimate dehydratase n=1 Tax=Alicyclobacillus sacchari TaxID=392010 RepID=A0A4R8LKW3_9BACL|nr:sugar phosphate isomerase/epimerase [Alicyclobacillus sacchari]TDY45203.1 3-dehydroshikimate dehydratase [Alicyclobacillus sacchari]GMA56796.1 hypothetical protein GCM10025858_12990 [Alicyclobacillus sacchari]
MKWSVCTTGMKEHDVQWVLQQVDLWRREGASIDGLELWEGHLEPYASRNALEGLIEQLEGNRVEVPVVSGYTYFSQGPAEREKDILKVQQLAAIGRKIGAKAVRTFFGHIPSAKTSPELWDESLMALRHAAKIAYADGMELWVETHYQTFADHLDALEELIEATRDCDVKLIFDPANFNPDHIDPLQVLDAMYASIAHVHCKNYHWNHDCWYRSQPVSVFDPTGDVNNTAVLRELQGRGYTGYVSLEYFGHRGWSALLRSLAECRGRSA